MKQRDHSCQKQNPKMMSGFGTHSSLDENVNPKALEHCLPANPVYAWLVPIALSIGIIISSNANVLELETTLLDC